jgi:hypothetical protein
VRDIEIKNLTLKEGLLEGKDEVIATLNRNIEKLEHHLAAHV